MSQIILVIIIINALSERLISNNYYLNNDFISNFKNLRNKKEILNLTLILFLLISILTFIFYIIFYLTFFHFEKFKILLLIMPFFFLNGFLIFLLKIYKNKSIIYNQSIKYFIIIILIFKYFGGSINFFIYIFLLTYFLEVLTNYFLFLKKFEMKVSFTFSKDYRILFFTKKFFRYFIFKQYNIAILILFLFFYIILLLLKN
jgi:hypothetical protein